MIFIHIDTKNYNTKNSKNNTPIDELSKYIDDNIPIFALIYMEHCGPCNATRPEWKKIKNILKNKENSNIIIVDIDKDVLDKIPKLKINPSGFPTIAYIKSGVIENYEDSSIENKDRRVDSFVEWIESKGKMIGGGIQKIDPKDITSFSYFISNSKISFLTKGANGVTFVARLIDPSQPHDALPPDWVKQESTREPGKFYYYNRITKESSWKKPFNPVINPVINSPYKYINSDTYGTQVSQLLFKITFVDDVLARQRFSLKSTNSEYSIIETDAFKKEVNIQTDIFLKSMQFLQPICPAPVFADVIENRDIIVNVLNSLISNGDNDKTIKLLEEIKYIMTHPKTIIKFGIIGMEYMNNCVTMHQCIAMTTITETNKKLYINMCLYLLLRLALETEYSQGDYHFSNILINLNQDDYFHGLKGGPLIIDFGLSRKIPPNILKNIKTKCVAKDYTGALKEMCKVNRSDDLIMANYVSFYGWACGKYDQINDVEIIDFEPDTNDELKKLFELRETAIDELVKQFNEKHAINKNVPLLPLSNENKKYMFAGLIGGRRNKRRKISNKKKTKRKQKNKRKNKSIKYK